jgi:cytochrome b6-f complex iron-sulfur subunit
MTRSDGPNDSTGAIVECAALLPEHRLTRRAVFGVASGLVAAGCSRAPKWDVQRVEATQGMVELDLKDYPPLATAGGMVAVKPSDTRDAVLVMRIENDQFRVLSLKCPHLGCTVRWDDELQLLVCPCHGSKFSDRGRRLEGPAKSGLPMYQARRIGTKIQFKTRDEL